MNGTPAIETNRRDEQAVFHDIVEQYKRPMYYLALDLTGNHHDAEDLAQEVFIKVFRSLDRFRGEASMHTWLRRIMINTYLNTRRKKALSFMRFFGDEASATEHVDHAPSPDRMAEGSLVQAALDRGVASLALRERSAFVLRHYQDLPIREVADAMGIAEGTVKSLLFRATKKLQKTLAHYGNELASSGGSL